MSAGHVVLGLALLLVVFGPWVLPEFAQNTLVRSCLYAVVAITVDLLWGYTGILTFGQATFFGIGAYAAGLVFTHVGFSPGMALAALAGGIAVSMVVAALVGVLSFYPGATPLYASVISLVLPIVATQVIFAGGTFTGSSSGLSGFESFDLDIRTWLWISGGLLVAATLCALRFVRSDTGRLLRAIRENESRCEYLGVNTSRVKTLLLVALSGVCALAGFVYACYGMVVAPEMAGFQFGTELIIWVALGGRGTVLGPVFGALVIDVGSAYLSGDLPFVWKLLLGVAFVFVIVVMPKGLLPALVRRFRRAPAAEPGTLATAPDEPLAGLASRGRLALRVAQVARSFGSLSVLRDVSFDARHGELLSLVGPNGAGKTTLMRCISDGGERSAGTIALNDHDIGRRPPFECVRLGIGRKFQTANVFEDLTVLDALAVARTRLARPRLWSRTTTVALPGASLAIVRTTGLDQVLDTPCRLLSHGQKQALELAMVLALDPNIVLLDEPTAGLTKPERTQIGATLQMLARDHQMCVVLIEHDLDFVCDISSRVIVLHQGEIVLDGSVRDVVESALVRDIYAGAAALPAEVRA
ncbi:MAG: ATP-binding cassette domain-containing protein [Variovorax sp.]|nr:MAG: ATP-binding cassette domain-containing protein [Variovorax sp.]